MKRFKEPVHRQSVVKNPPMAKLAVNADRWKYYGALAFILVLSFIAYLPALHNGLLSWDDNSYIRDNPLLYSFNLKEIFSRNVVSNYHPLTILTLALEYQFFGLNPTGYHAFNVLLHLLNVILVFYAVYLISDKAGVALLASLLFGIHPIHAESVAWVAELKDLLYTFFYLASYILYLKYINDRNKKFYIYALLLFLASILSKAMAASLPVVLLLTDYFKGRKINLKTLSEKIPFFLLAIAFGIVALLAQKSSGASDVIDLSFPQRIIFACYGFISYLVKLILPLNLCAYYPYPVGSGESIPLLYYIYLILFTGLAVIVFYSLRYTKKILFGIGFFALTVFLVLQLLPVGGAVMADRYSYIPSIGIFYLAGEGFYFLWGSKRKWIAIILLSGFTVFFSAKTYTRCSVWKSDMTLWNDVISQYQTIPEAYFSRGNAYKSENKYELAYADFNKAIELDPNYAQAYYNRGTAFMEENKHDQALADFNKAIKLDPNFPLAYNNRGNVFLNENKYELALADFNKAIELNPGLSQAYNNRGNVFANIKKYDEALADFRKAIELNPNNAKAYNNRGNALANISKYDQALVDFSKAIELNPNYFEAYFNRGSIFKHLKKYEPAIADFSKVVDLKPKFSEAYYNRGIAEYYSGRKEAACMDLKQAASLGSQQAADALPQICK
jgi:tetratricopeptide (TPR) repeat protein